MKKALCKCQCGQEAPIATYTSKTYGWIKGQPKAFIHGHNGRGMKRSEETKMKLSIANKGQVPWHVGTDRHKGEDNPQWKGDKVGYAALHEWVKKRLAKPFSCNHCEEIKPLDLANKSGLYTRDLTDWFWLCRGCHIRYDRKYSRGVIERRFNQ